MPQHTVSGHMNVQEQLRALRENDEKALRLFYQANYPKVERYVLENNGSADEAKDVYQEAFIAVWRNIQLGRFQPRQGTSLDGYIYQVAKNKWLDHLRAVKRKPVIPLTDETNGLEAVPDLSEEEQQRLASIKTNLEQLGQICRDVLVRFYYHRQSMRTISIALKWTEETAKNNKYRCLQRLRESLKTNKPNLG